MKIKLIDNWKQWPWFTSVNLPILGATIVGFAEQLPSAFAYVWALLPVTVVAAIPPDYIRAAGIALVFIGALSRAIKQTRLESK